MWVKRKQPEVRVPAGFRVHVAVPTGFIKAGNFLNAFTARCSVKAQGQLYTTE